MLRGMRGAIQVERNEPEDILNAAAILMKRLDCKEMELNSTPVLFVLRLEMQRLDHA